MLDDWIDILVVCLDCRKNRLMLPTKANDKARAQNSAAGALEFYWCLLKMVDLEQLSASHFLPPAGPRHQVNYRP